MAVGLPLKTTYANGDVFSASDINDTNGTINITASPFAAGKNKIINGDFNVWQRGTSVSATNTYAYISDRWQSVCDGAITGARTAFTPGAAPVAGYEGNYYLRYTKTSGTYWQIQQYIEDVQTFAGQTATISFWAKVDAAKTVYVQLSQNFGSGGSSTVTTTAGTQALTTSWVRYSFTVAVPSISGKTVGTSSNLALEIGIAATTGNITFDIWGVQVEAGSTATAFQTATGTIQGELAACQRYYWRFNSNAGSTYQWFGLGLSKTSTTAELWLPNPVPMRTGATSLDYANLMLSDLVNYNLAVTAASLSNVNSQGSSIAITNASGATAVRTAIIRANISSSAYIGASAEL